MNWCMHGCMESAWMHTRRVHGWMRDGSGELVGRCMDG